MASLSQDPIHIELRRFFRILLNTEEKVTQSRTLVELAGRLLLQVDDELINLDSFIRLTRRRTALALEQHARSATASLGSSNMASFAAEFKELIMRYDVLGNLPFVEENVGEIDVVSSAKAAALSVPTQDNAKPAGEPAMTTWKKRLENNNSLTNASSGQNEAPIDVEESMVRVARLLADPGNESLPTRVVQLLDGPDFTI